MSSSPLSSRGVRSRPDCSLPPLRRPPNPSTRRLSFRSRILFLSLPTNDRLAICSHLIAFDMSISSTFSSTPPTVSDAALATYKEEIISLASLVLPSDPNDIAGQRPSMAHVHWSVDHPLFSSCKL